MNRKQAPNTRAIQEINTNFPESKTNLFRIKSEEGVFKLEIVFPNAGQVEGENKFAIGMAINLLMSGHRDKSAALIAEEIDELGGFVFKSSDFYSASISIYGLNENISETIRLTKMAIDHVAYLDEEIEVYKRNKISELNINLQKTSYLASKGINTLLCGKEHDISFQTTESIIKSTTRESLIAFKDQSLINPYFIFTGSESSEIEKIIKDNQYEILPYSGKRHTDMSIRASGESALFIPKENATQNSIRIGAIWPMRGHEDYFKLTLLNLILGGFFGSRLMKNIREDKGLTYGIHSSITPYNDFSVFKISCEYNSEFTLQLKAEIIHEMSRLREEPVSEDELTIAKNYLLGVLLRSFDGAYPISDKFKQFMDAKLSVDYYVQYLHAINSITSDELMKTANNYLKENTLTYCISGV